MAFTFRDYLAEFQQPEHLAALTGIGRGIEREALRVLPEGGLSMQPHRYQLGSALTHPQITTDYSETLLEFITPVSHSPELAINQLRDIQKYTLSQVDGELLWPMSMPCFVEDADKIPLAQYGSSNIGKMKTVYRQGLKNRYGSMMQVIAGIHFNFSFSKSFWQTLQAFEGDSRSEQDYISAKYFALIRNYKRYCWLIPYLYGSSPAICPSFLQGKETVLPFEKSANGYLYLPYATSLRMSDLGYTNSDQAALYICYNQIDSYVNQVQKAISLSSEQFAKIGIKKDGEYQQLNSNVLQIENELYAPIRPKQIAKSGEKPSEALANRGVEYIEVRALDVNPFADTGISLEQVHFLDIFLTYCALKPSPTLNSKTQETLERNMDEVVVRGRDPELTLALEGDSEQQVSVAGWGQTLFDDMAEVAALLDQAHQTQTNQSQVYQAALATERSKILDANLTPSAQILAKVVEQGESLTGFALDIAKQHAQSLSEHQYQHYDLAHFEQSVAQSHQEQKNIEDADNVDFDSFLADYFAQ